MNNTTWKPEKSFTFEGQQYDICSTTNQNNGDVIIAVFIKGAQAHNRTYNTKFTIRSDLKNKGIDVMRDLVEIAENDIKNKIIPK